MADQHLDRPLGGDEKAWGLVVEVAPEMPHAVSAVQRAPDDVSDLVIPPFDGVSIT
jgi:hypothetical protein